MTRWLTGCLLLGVLGQGVLAQEGLEPSVSEADSLEQLLEGRGLVKTSDAERHRKWVEAILHLYDPFGEVLTEEELAEKNNRMSGLVTDPGWILSATGASFQVSGSMLDEDIEREIPEGALLTKIGEKNVRETSFSALQTVLRNVTTEEVLVEVESDKSDETTFTVKLHSVQRPTIALKEKLPEGLGYLRVYGLFEGAEKEVLKVLRSWTETDCYGLILDLRQAAGTNLDAVEKIASLLVPEGQFLFAFKSLSDEEIDVRHAFAGGPINQPLMILIDGKTSGASEVLAATLAGAGKGVMLLGQPTSGDLLIREAISYQGEYQLYITNRKLVTADGKEFKGKKAVSPNVFVMTRDGTPPYEPDPDSIERTLEEEAEDLLIRNRVRYDPVMRRAVDVLLGLKALNIRTGHASEKELVP